MAYGITHRLQTSLNQTRVLLRTRKGMYLGCQFLTLASNFLGGFCLNLNLGWVLGGFSLKILILILFSLSAISLFLCFSHSRSKGEPEDH